MKEQHLKPKQHYIDRYDRLTVERCRDLERLSKTSWRKEVDRAKKEQWSKKDIELAWQAHATANYFIMYTETGEAYLKKEETIRKWMEADKQRDDLLASAPAPAGITCLSCRSEVLPDEGELYSGGMGEKDRVLFMYECPNGCLPMRAFFNDGEEWRRKPNLCPECNVELVSDDKKHEDKIVIHEHCPSCDYTNTDEIELVATKEESDPDFEKDRERFCMSDEEGRQYGRDKVQIEQMGKIVDEWRERDAQKGLYEKIKRIQKLTVPQIEKLLTPALEKAGYIHITLKEPEISKNVTVSFTAQDGKDGREEYDSRIDLKHAINAALGGTNWRLSGDISYRLGVLSGKLRAYETEEDLLRLV